MTEDFQNIAARQSGVITRAQLRACGVSDDVVDRRLQRGLLVGLHRGVFAVAGAPDSFTRRITAAVLAVGGQAVASHRAAAVLLGLGEVPPRIEVTVPHGQRPRLPRVAIHRTTVLPGHHVIVRGGVRITTGARTLCDLAGVLSPRVVELTLDQALARRRVTRRELLDTLAELPRSGKGSGIMRELLDARPEGQARVESPLEKELHLLLERAKLEFRPQFWAEGCRIDAAFPAEKLAVQTDSYLHHSSRTDWVRDHKRQTALVEAGWRVLPVTAEDLRHGQQLIARIQRALGRDTSPRQARRTVPSA